MCKEFRNHNDDIAAIMNINGYWCVVIDGIIKLSFDTYHYYDAIVAIKNYGFYKAV